jgi:hypothetical protein
VLQAVGVDVVEITLAIDACRNHEKINRIHIMRGIFMCDPRCKSKGRIADVLTENPDLSDVRGMPCGNFGRDNDIHVVDGDPGAPFVLRRGDITLLFECGAADIEAIPTAFFTNCGNLICPGLILIGATLVYAGIICSIAINLHTFRLQRAQNGERELARHRKKVHADPGVGKGSAHFLEDGDQFFFFKIVVEKKRRGIPRLWLS